jgi:hypothetical protein
MQHYPKKRGDWTLVCGKDVAADYAIDINSKGCHGEVAIRIHQYGNDR